MHDTAFRTSIIAAVALAAIGCSDPSTSTQSSVTGSPRFTASSGQTTTQLARGTVDPFHINSDYNGHKVEIKSQDQSDVIVNSSSLAPGGTTGWHTHSGPVLVVVTSGVFTMYHADDPSCTPMAYPAGTTFTERGGTKDIHIGRNEGTVPLTWVATAIVGVGVPGRVDEPAPGNCPF
jgi:hypothetical protein